MMRFRLAWLTVVGGWLLSAAAQAQPAPINLALNKPAQQSSTSQWSHANDAQGAVDGIKNGGYAFHTNHEPNPWWQVDLQTMSTLTEVRIYNRLELPDRARTIQVLLSNDGATWRQVYAHNGRPFGGTDGKPLVVSLNGAQARFLRLQLGETIWFHLDEVEVYGVANGGDQVVPTGRSYTAQPRGPGAQVTIAAYGKDETDGSDVGWNAQYPAPSFDDDPNRRGLPNARWQGAHWWQGNQLCLGIKNLEAPYPPAHTLAVGYTVTLASGAFDDGSATKTFVLYRFSGQPAQKEISQCVAITAAGAGTQAAGLIETLVIPNDRPGKVTSRTVLEKDRWYLLEASGVVSDWSHVKDGVDAAWCYAEWRCGKQGEAWNQLRIDEKGLTELAVGGLPKSPDHVYRIRYQGQGKRLEAYASDAQSSASDNSGSFTLRIFQEGAPAGTGAPSAACRGFAGDWSTQHGMVHLDVDGQTAAGSYPYKQGRIEGRVAGPVLEGRWIQSDRPGLLRFELTPDGGGFKGTWTEADGRGGGGWDGTCVSGPQSAPPAPPAVSTPTATTTTTWATTAADHRSQTGQRFTYLCPANGTPARVWGTDVYTDDSSVCTAATHAGLISPAGGGTVTIEMRPGQPSYMGTGRYGVMTDSYGPWTGSYVIVGTTAPPQGRSYTAQPRR